MNIPFRKGGAAKAAAANASSAANAGAAGGRRTAASAAREEERRLLSRAQAGDAEAFDAIVRLYEKQVYNLAYRLCGNYDDANDIAADAFVRVFNAMGRFRGDSAFSTWLYRIVTNAFLDERKRRQSHPQISLDDDMDMEGASLQRQIEDDAPSPGAMAEEKEVRRMLDRAIQTLPDFQRDIMVMYHVNNMSYDEIGEVTGLPVGTVKSRLNRARLALRDLLEGQRDVFE